LLLHEPVDASVLVGGALVVAGVWFLNRVAPSPPAATPA
jgi:drug/metabolite transporter (DMT)-like permease